MRKRPNTIPDIQQKQDETLRYYYNRATSLLRARW